MTIIDSAGKSIDSETWSQLLDTADNVIKHRLWVAVIREVALSVVERDVNTKEDGPAEYNIEDLQYELIDTWLDDALPSGDDLAYVLGELDYFRDIDLSWDEKINFSGYPCGYCSEVVWELKEKLESYPDAQDAITEDSVDTFYLFWRTRFFKNVLKAAISLK